MKSTIQSILKTMLLAMCLMFIPSMSTRVLADITVHLDPNGGTSLGEVTLLVPEDGEAQLELCPYYYESGKQFAGWSIEQEESAGLYNIRYYEKDTVTYEQIHIWQNAGWLPQGDDVTLYAQWIPMPDINCQTTDDPNRHIVLVMPTFPYDAGYGVYIPIPNVNNRSENWRNEPWDAVYTTCYFGELCDFQIHFRPQGFDYIEDVVEPGATEFNGHPIYWDGYEGYADDGDKHYKLTAEKIIEMGNFPNLPACLDWPYTTTTTTQDGETFSITFDDEWVEKHGYNTPVDETIHITRNGVNYGLHYTTTVIPVVNDGHVDDIIMTEDSYHGYSYKDYYVFLNQLPERGDTYWHFDHGCCWTQTNPGLAWEVGVTYYPPSSIITESQTICVGADFGGNVFNEPGDYTNVEWTDGDNHLLYTNVHVVAKVPASSIVGECTHGTVEILTPEDFYCIGSSVLLEAKPDVENCYGTNNLVWSDGQCPNCIQRNFVITGTPITATFQKQQFAIISKKTYGDTGSLTLNGEPYVEGKTVSCGTDATLEATAKPGYIFVGWEDKKPDDCTGDVSSTENPRTFQNVQSEITVCAIFKSAITINITSEDDEKGVVTITDENGNTINPGDQVTGGTKLTITETPNEHYHFVEWSDGDKNPTREIEAGTENSELKAIFAKDAFAITTSVNEPTYGSAAVITTPNADGKYEYGTEVTLRATLTSDCGTFVRWAADGITSTERIITVTTDANYLAIFTQLDYAFEVLATNGTAVAEVGGININELGNRVNCGSDVTITATASEGYHFVNWSDGNTNPTRVINNVRENKSFKAEFAKNQNALNVTINNPEGGSLIITNTETGDEVHNGDMLDFGTELLITPNPTNNCWELTSWGDGTDVASHPTVTKTVNAEGLTIVVTFSQKNHQVTFVDGNNTIMKTVTIACGETAETAVPTETPTKDPTLEYSYDFEGWDYDISNPITEDKEIHAIFTSIPNTYTITWDANGGLFGSESTKTTSEAFGATITVPTEPTREGYSFNGWSSVDATMPAHDVSYTATWTVNGSTPYTVEHYKQNVTGEEYTLAETENLTGATDSEITPATKGYTGFTAPASQTTTIKGNGSTLVQYYYKRVLYTITFMVNGATAQQSDFRYEAEPTYGGVDPTRLEDSKYTYVFDTWNPAITKVTTAATYEATFTQTPKQYELTWDANGGTIPAGTYTKGQTEYDTHIVLPADPTKTGYIFNGWSPTPSAKMPDDNTTYTAQWIEKTDVPYVVYHKKQNVDDDEYTTADTDNLTGATGATVTPATKTYEGFETPTTETLTIAADGTSTLTYLYNRKTFTAKWIVEGTEQYTQTYRYGATVNADAYAGTTPEKAQTAAETYTFAGWDGENGVMNANRTYTAKFTASKRAYTLTWNLNGGTVKTAGTAAGDVEVGTTLTAPTVEKTGYTFNGWTPTVPTTMPAANAEYAAQWLASTGTEYKVYTYLQALTGDDYAAPTVETFNGTTGATVNPTPKSIEGFVTPVAQSLVITADGTAKVDYYYLRNTYTIEFKVGTNVVSTASVRYEAPITVPANPENYEDAAYSYTFQNWTPAVPATATKNETFTAVFDKAAKSFTLTWDLDGGSIATPGTAAGEIAYGTALTAPVVTREFYDFNGWSPEFVSGITMPAAATTYTATWKPQTLPYTVKHYQQHISDNDYDLFDTEDKTATYMTEVNPATKDYTGFNKPAVQTVTIDAAHKEISYYYDRKTYTITFTSMGLSTTKTYRYGDMPSFPAPFTEKDLAGYHYEFKGWNTPFVAVTADATYEALVDKTPINYPLNWELDGGTITTPGTPEGDTPFNSDIIAPVVEKTGYNFNGWTPAFTGKMPAKAVTYTALWAALTDVQYTVNHYLEQLDGTYPATPDESETKYGTTGADATPDVKTITGFTAQPVTAQTIAADGSTIVNCYYNRNEYKVTFVAEETKAEMNCKYGSHADYSTIPTKPSTAEYDYTFTGWTPKPEETEIVEPTTFTATFSQTARSYNLTWNVNGGNALTGTFTQGSVVFGTTITKPTAPTRDGYTFDGWNPDLTTMPAADTECKAQWVAAGDTKYTVRHYQMNLDGINKTLIETENLSGTTGTEITPVVKSYTGFIAPATQTVTIAADGSTTVDYIYLRKTFTIQFVSEGETKQTGTYQYEQEVTYTQADPTKTSTKEYNYTFTGWDKEIVKATENTTYTAQFEQKANKYELTWVTDGDALEGTYTKGQTAYNTTIVAPNTPTKAGWTFSGWNPGVETTMPAEDRTYTAQWLPAGNTPYTVNHLKRDIKATTTTLAEAETLQGTTGAEVTPAVKNYEGFTAPALQKITIAADGSSVVNYIYERKTYKADFVIEGLTVQTGTVEYEEYAHYTGATPTKPETTAYSYTFANWTPAPEGTKVTADTKFNAVFTEVAKSYPLTWDVNGGSELTGDYTHGTVAYGTAIVKPADPTKTGYTFAGWTPAVATTMPAVATTYTAVWNPATGVQYVVRHHMQKVEGSDYDVTTETLYGVTGTSVTPELKVVEGFQSISDKQTKTIAADGTTEFDYYYNRKTYKIGFFSEGIKLQEEEVRYGAMAEFKGTTPVKEQSAEYTYAFDTWSPALHSVTEPQTYQAVYTSTPREYMLTWVTDGEPLTGTYTQGLVAYGTTITAPATPQKTGYIFAHWDKTVSTTMPAEATTYTAVWTAASVNYTVRHYVQHIEDNEYDLKETENLTAKTAEKVTPLAKVYTGFVSPAPQEETVLADGSLVINYYYDRKTFEITFYNGTVLLEKKDWRYGATPYYNGIPTREASVAYTYTFSGNWSPAISVVSGKQKYEAQFDQALREYPVDIKPDDGDGDIIIEPSTGTIPYGSTITMTAPERDCYQFIKWSNDATNNPLTIKVNEEVIKDSKVTIRAHYEKIKYDIQFVNYNNVVLKAGKVLCGELPVYDLENPTRPATTTETYVFAGWNEEIVAAKANKTYTAQYTTALNRTIDSTIYVASFTGKKYIDGEFTLPIPAAGDYPLDYLKTVNSVLYHITGTLHVIDVRSYTVEAGVVHGCDAGTAYPVTLPWMDKDVNVALGSKPGAQTSSNTYQYDGYTCQLNLNYNMLPVDTVYETIKTHSVNEFPIHVGNTTYAWPGGKLPNQAWTLTGVEVCDPCGFISSAAPARGPRRVGGLTPDILHILNIEYTPEIPVVKVGEMIDICHGDTFNYKDRHFSEQSVYFDTLINYQGMDSVFMLIVNVHPDFHFYEYESMYEMGSYTWEGHIDPITGVDRVFTTPGVYFDSAQTVYGCDSVYRLTLTMVPQDKIITYDTVCSSELPYVWDLSAYCPACNTHLLNSTGVYTETRHSAERDTVMEIHLLVNEKKFTTETHYLCHGETFYRNGHLYEEGNKSTQLVYDTLVTTAGCDSIHAIYLHWAPAYVVNRVDTVYGTDKYIWRDVFGNERKTIYHSGIYYDTLQSAHGCDSIIRLDLTMIQTQIIPVDVTVCRNEMPYVWTVDGTDYTYYTEGEYEKHIRSAHGEDSVIYHLNLMVNEPKFTLEQIGFCEGGSALVGGHLFETAGQYDDTLRTLDGCDSIVRYVVNVWPTYHYYETITSSSPSFEWRGRVLTHSGVYNDTIPSGHGCDSIYELNLTLTTGYYQEDVIYVRELELPYLWHGRQIYQSDIYKDTIAAATGDSIYVLTVHIVPTKYGSVSEQICPGGTYVWEDHNMTLSKAGVYYDTVRTSNGLYEQDSITVLTLGFRPSYHIEYDEVLTGGGSYYWPITALTYEQPGRYEVRKNAIDACDSVFVLNLHYNAIYTEQLDTTICQSELPFLWRGRQIYDLGTNTYRDSVVMAIKPDSLYVLNLTVNPVSINEIYRELCGEDSIEYNDTIIRTAGVYTFHINSAHACDSIVRMVVNKTGGYHSREAISLRSGDTMTWHGQTISTAGTFYHYEYNENGCRDTYELKVSLYTDYYIEHEAAICEGETYHWDVNGNNYTMPGDYYRMGTTADGHDSIHVLHLTVNPIRRVSRNIELCKGSSLSIHEGLTISEAGIYADTLHTIDGCDSIVTYIANYAQNHVVNLYDEFCSGSTYTWHGMAITEPGIYSDTLHTVSGCDSIVRLTLNMASGYDITRHVKLCYGETLEINGHAYSESGVIDETLLSSHGCDSTIHWVITMMPEYHYYDTATLVGNETMTWHGQTINRGGHYRDNQHTEGGCDLIYELYVIHYPTYHYLTTAVICSSEAPYVWAHNGLEYAETGIYTIPYKTVNGQDSVFVLDLTVNPVKTTVVNAQVCQGQTYTYNGVDLTEGIHEYTYPAVSGCDSIVRVIVSPAAEYRYTEHRDMAIGQSFLWHGQTIAAGGTYEDRYTSINGCDSVYILTVSTYPTYHFEQNIRICQSELPYEYEGHTFASAGTYDYNFLTAEGYDSTYIYHVDVLPVSESTEHRQLCRGDVLNIRALTISEPGVYNDTLRAANGCDSIVHIVVNYAKSYIFDEYATMHEGSSYTWHHEMKGGIYRTFTEKGVYFDSAVSVDGCDSIYRLTLTYDRDYLFHTDSTVCQNQLPVSWHGMTLNPTAVDTTVYDSLMTALGMDSVYILNLHVQDTAKTVVVMDFCEGQTITLLGHEYNATAIVRDTLPRTNGCDSIVEYLLRMNPGFYQEERHYVAPNSDYNWAGHQTVHVANAAENIFWDTNSNQYGCDSTYKLTLIVQQPYHFIKDTALCTNSEQYPYIWRGHTLFNDTILFDSLKTVTMGVDSVYELRLHVDSAHVITKTIELCNGDYFTLNGVNYTEAGIIEDTIPTMAGCDSIFRYVLHFEPIQYRSMSAVTCKGNTYTWHHNDTETYVTKQGTYYDTVRNVHGCDSVIYQLQLTLSSDFYERHTDTICQREAAAYTYRGLYLADLTVGTHAIRDEFITIGGCDSIYEMLVTVRPDRAETVVPVNRCEGSEFYFHGTAYTITHDTVFADTLSGKTACDSIVRYVVSARPVLHNVADAAICMGDSYLWHGRTLTEAGTYYDDHQSIYGCDSTYELHLTLNSRYEFPTVVTLDPDSLPYLWRDRLFWGDAQVEDTFLTAKGCDSIYSLDLTVCQHVSEEELIYLCEGSELVIGGHTYTTPGRYMQWRMTPGAQTADSIYRFRIELAPVYESHDSVVVCETEWENGIVYHYTDAASGQIFNITAKKDSVYRIAWQSTAYGCDSVVYLHFGFRPATKVYKQINVCQGDYYAFRGEEVTETGVFTDTLKTLYGCDSIIHYTINFVETHHFNELDYINENGTYTWYGHKGNIVLTEPGGYWDSLQTVNGCDSVFHLQLVERSNYLYITDTTICSSSFLEWRDRRFTETGIYWDSLQTVNGADSVFCLNLTVRSNAATTVQQTVCQGSTLSFNGQTAEHSGVYRDTLLTHEGCDSVVTYIVNVMPAFYYNQIDSVRLGETYNWEGHGMSLTTAGIYYDRHYSVNGCDSTYVLQLNVLENRSINICENDVYPFYGTDITEAGTYRHVIRTQNEADSIITLVVNKFSTVRTEKVINLCHGETLHIGDMTFGEPGIYFDTLLTTMGCDSIVKYVVNRHPQFLDVTNPAYITGGNYVWYGHGVGGGDRLLTEPGVYWDSLQSQLTGCDSIYKLVLTELKAAEIVEFIDTCAGSHVLWHGHTYSAAGTYYDSLKSIVTGLDSVHILHLSFNGADTTYYTAEICEGETWTLNETGQTFNHTNVYTISTSEGCGHVYIVNLTVNPVFKHTDRVTICESEAPYQWRDRMYNVSGTYTDSLISSHGCDSIYNLILTVHPSPRTNLPEEVLCHGEYVEHKGQRIIRDTVYNDTLTTAFGCDSIVRHTIRFAPYQLREQNQHINKGESYLWHAVRDTMITTSGLYEQIVRSAVAGPNHGCDSIVYRLNLYVDETREVSICQGDRFEFRGQQYVITENTVFTDSLLDSHGSDSLVRYVVTVLPTYSFYEHTTLCSTDYIEWHGQRVHAAGRYVDAMKTVDGCDSIYYLDVTLAQAYDERDEQLVAPEELPYTWRGRDFWVDTLCVDTFRTMTGCDSLFTLDLRIADKYNTPIDTFFICPGHPITINHKEYVEPGMHKQLIATPASGNRPDSIYRFVLVERKQYEVHDSILVCESEFEKGVVYHYNYPGGVFDITSKQSHIYDIVAETVEGCDSLIHLHFGVQATQFTTVPKNVCIGELVWYHDRWNAVTEKGIVFDTLYTHNGCDSIVKYVFNLLPTPITEHQVNLCENDTFRIYRKSSNKPMLITTDGIYYDTVPSNQGCDSIVKYIVHFTPTFRFERYATINEGGTYIWKGHGGGGTDKFIDRPGVYWDSCYTVNGCDSIFRLNVLQNHDYLRVLDTTICENDAPFEWRDQIFYHDTCFVDTLYRQSGMDSIIVLNLRVVEPQLIEQHVMLCSGDSLILRDEMGERYAVTMPGVYEEVLMGSNYCDSIIRYIVNRALRYERYDTVSIERGESYAWVDTVVTVAGDYRRTLLTIDGCDSVLNLHVNVHSTYRTDTVVAICYSERPFLWRDQRCYFDGDYTDTIHSDFSRDSIFTLHLTVYDPVEPTIVDARLCHGDTLYIRDRKIWEAGTYYDTLTTRRTGCDSVITYIVTNFPTYRYEERRMMCEGSSVIWRGHGPNGTDRILNKEGVYWDSLQTVHGCDSVFKLTVVSSHRFAVDTTIVWCWDDLPYYHSQNHRYYHVGDFPQGYLYLYDTLYTSLGCDSIIRTRITLTNKCNHVLDTIYFCEGQEHPNVIAGQTIDHEGLYHFNCWSFDGYTASLDSVNRAIAIKSHPYHFYETRIVCQGDMTEDHHGFIPGSYPAGEHHITLHYSSIHGCDSIYDIDLIVHPSYHHLESDWQMRDFDEDELTFTDHNGDPVTFLLFGSQCQTGKHDTTLVIRTDYGCEETFKLSLTVVETQYIDVDARVCARQLPYTFKSYDPTDGLMHDVEVWDEGVYRAEYYRPGSNLSIVYTYYLSIDTESQLDTAYIDVLCQQTRGGASDMRIYYETQGSTPTEYDLEFSPNAIREGFRNVRGGLINANYGYIRVDWPTFRTNDEYVRPDNTYYVDVTFTNGACGTMGGNSRRLYFTVLYPAWITESLFDHTIALLNENYNGGYVFSDYTWFVNDHYVPTTKAYIYDPNGDILNAGDRYYVELTRMGENYAIATCETTYTPSKPAGGKPTLKVSATQPGAAPIRIKADNDGHYLIYSEAGQFCGKGTFHSGEQDIVVPDVKGVYIVHMETVDGIRNAEKAIVF